MAHAFCAGVKPSNALSISDGMVVICDVAEVLFIHRGCMLRLLRSMFDFSTCVAATDRR